MREGGALEVTRFQFRLDSLTPRASADTGVRRAELLGAPGLAQQMTRGRSLATGSTSLYLFTRGREWGGVE